MRASPLVWAVWGILTVCGLAFVAAYGRNCPFMDEWEFVDALGPDTDLLRWALEAHGEHRYPVPRLVFAGLFRLTGDLRTAMVANVLSLSAAAALLIRAARRARGRTALADVLFPLLLLHAGHWENVLMAYQVNFTGGVLLAAGLLTVAVVPPVEWTRREVVAAGAAVVLLPGYGILGALYATAAAVWLAVVGWRVLHRTSPRRAWFLIGAAAVAGAELTAYAATQAPSPFAAIPRRWNDLAGTALRMPAAAFGPGLRFAWPAAAGLAALVGAANARVMWRTVRAGEWPRAAGLTAVTAAGCAVLAGIAWGRGWSGPEVAFMPRYAALGVPVLAGAALTAVRLGGPRAAALVPAVLAVVAAVSWPLNLDHGLFHARRTSGHTDALVQEYRADWPAELICARHDWQVLQVAPLTRAQFGRLPTVAGLGFAPRGTERRVRVERLDGLTVSGVHGAAVENGSVTGAGSAAAVRIALPSGREVLAVRVTGKFDPPSLRMARSRVRWKPADSDRREEEHYQLGRGVEMSFVTRVRGPVAAIEFHPDDGPWGYRVTAVELFVPDDSGR